MVTTGRYSSRKTEKPREQRQGPAFGVLIGLVFLVLALGLIGGGWYGHTRLAQSQFPSAGMGVTLR